MPSLRGGLHDREKAGNDTMNSLPPELQDLVDQEVERRLKDLGVTVPQPFETLDDPPILHTLGHVPRDVPLSVRLYLRLGATSTQLPGLLFAGFGFIFALIAVGIMGLDDAIPRNWSDAGKAKITSVERTRFSINEESIYAYHFESPEQQVVGVSYGYKGRYKTDDEVPLQKAGNRYRVQNLTLARGGSLSLLFFGAGSLIGVFGLCFPIYSWFVGKKAIRLLREGTATKARHLATTPTNMRVNKQSVMKVNFEYQVDGETYTASATALDISRLTDSPCKVVLYDPMQPEKSIVLDGLPYGINIDELSGRFWVNPLRCMFPLLMATIVCSEIVAIVVLVIRAI